MSVYQFPKNIKQPLPILEVYQPRASDLWYIILLYPLGFLLLYSQVATIDSQYDQFWKIPLIVSLLLYIFFKKKDKGTYPLFFTLGILFAIKQLVIAIPSALQVEDLGSAFVDLFFPTLILLFIYQVSYHNIERLIFYFTSIIILSTIPYHLGVIENPNIVDDLNNSLHKYGHEGTLFLGPFNNIHD